VDEVARGEGLEGDPRRLPALAEVGELGLEVDARVDERVVEAESALQHAGRAFGAERGQPHRDERAVRGPGRVDRLGRGGVVEVGEEARGHAAGDAERAGRLGDRETAQPCGGGGCAEDPADRRRVEAAPVKRPRGGHADPGDDLVASNDRGQQLAPVRSPGLGEGGRSRNDHRADVRDRVGVRVVEVEPVAEHRVRERGVRRRETGLQPDDGRLGLAAQLRHRLPALAGDPQPVRGQAAAEHVEHVQLRRLDHLLGQGVELQLERECGEPFRCGGHHTLHSSPVPGKLRSASGAERL
jgi:hypothetical protein